MQAGVMKNKKVQGGQWGVSVWRLINTQGRLCLALWIDLMAKPLAPSLCDTHLHYLIRTQRVCSMFTCILSGPIDDILSIARIVISSSQYESRLFFLFGSHQEQSYTRPFISTRDTFAQFFLIQFIYFSPQAIQIGSI